MGSPTKNIQGNSDFEVMPRKGAELCAMFYAKH